MAIIANSFETFEEEIYWIVNEVKKYLQVGTLPQEIAIISRKHDTLSKFQSSLSSQQMVVNYDKSDNIFDNPGLNQLTTIVKYINSLLNLNRQSLDYLLPEILSYEFWGLSTTDIWNLAIAASTAKNSWLEYTQSGDNLKVKKIVEFLVVISRKSKVLTAEEILDLLIGNQSLNQVDSSSEEIANSVETKNQSESLLKSPFKDFYFKNNAQDLELLSALKSLYEAIRAHTQKHIFYISDMITYLDLVSFNNLKIYNKSTFFQNPEGINLLTAHKSKGLEFEVVFVVNCIKSEWESGGMNTKISFPNQMAITPDKDNSDDFIRLFYVAVTRSKNTLILTKSEKDTITAKDKEGLTFNNFNFEKIVNSLSEKNIIFNQEQQQNNTQVFTEDLKKLLIPVVTNYKLSVSGLLNFIDITKGGPIHFLENNLLRFPQAKVASASYGTAVHSSLKDIYNKFKVEKKLPNLEYFLNSFEKLLLQQNLNEKDFLQYLNLGQKELTIYYNQKSIEFKMDSVLEMSFNNQEVHLENALITGQIDKMDINKEKDEIMVADFKTGKASDTFEPTEDFNKQKMWNYRQQLIFYKLLIENSAIYGQKYRVKTGQLEFIKADHSGRIITLKLDIIDDEANKLEDLVNIVYQKIVNLDFPDISQYKVSFQGTLDFVNDLLNHKI